MEGGKDFAASAEALGIADSSDGFKDSIRGGISKGGGGIGYKYQNDISSNMMSQEMRHAKLSELDEDAMDSPRTSKLLAARDQ